VKRASAAFAGLNLPSAIQPSHPSSYTYSAGCVCGLSGGRAGGRVGRSKITGTLATAKWPGRPKPQWGTHPAAVGLYVHRVSQIFLTQKITLTITNSPLR
jgi:hypothetical protein